MLKVKWILPLLVIGVLSGVPGCMELSGSSLQRMISTNDHHGLANYYSQQAQELREKARQWEFMAEYYDVHSEGLSKAEAAQHSAHCRAIAESYKKAAGEADALAQKHRAMRTHA